MRRLSNQIKTIVLLGGLSAVLVASGSLLGTSALYAFTLLAVAMNVAAFFFSDRLVLRMHGAQEVPRQELPRVHQMVAEIAASAQIPSPRLFLVDDAQPNAFATGRNPRRGVVAVTSGLLHLLDERELRGVLAHEIAHIKNRDVLVATIAAVLAGAITYAAHALSLAAFFGGAGEEGDEGEGSAGQGLLAVLLAPLAATLIQLGVSRAREYLADETAASLTGDPEALAAALDKLEWTAAALPPSGEPVPATASLFIVNPLAGGSSLARWFSTHPPIEDRVARLRSMARAPRVAWAA